MVGDRQDGAASAAPSDKKTGENYFDESGEYLSDAEIRKLQGVLLKRPGGDREMVEILALVLLHDVQAVLPAVELALEAGVPSKQTVLNILSRLLDSAPVPPLQTPQAFPQGRTAGQRGPLRPLTGQGG